MTRRLFLFAPFAAAFAQSPGLVEGFRLLYHLRFSEGRAIFLQWQSAHPVDPLGYAAEAASHLFEEFEHQGVLTAEFFLDDDRLLRGIRGSGDPARTKAFELANDKARLLAESQLKRDVREPNALFSLTLASGMSAHYDAIVAKEQIESLRQIRATEKFSQRLLAVAPSMADGYMPLGAANYILACLPSYKRAVLWFGGMQGNKQRGMDQLAQAAGSGVYLAPFAKILLSLALLREKRNGDARRLMGELTTNFPESPLFARERAKIDRIR